MTDALLAIDRDITAGKWQSRQKQDDREEEEISLYQLHPEVRMSLAQAWDAEKEEILLSQAVGRIAGDFVNLYPPGIPVLVPGEQIEETHCRQLAEYLKEDLNVQGVTKDAGYRITVVKNK